VDTLLASIARPPPATTAFIEVRFSQLLARPLIVRGELEHLRGGALIRNVTEPFKERTEIDGDRVSVEREGKPPRYFSLQSIPGLAGLLGGFAAVLGGSRAAVEQDFNLALQGDTAHWRLELRPKSPRQSRYVHDIAIYGRDAAPRCIVVTPPDRSPEIMLVESAARTELPSPPTLQWLRQFCDSGGA